MKKYENQSHDYQNLKKEYEKVYSMMAAEHQENRIDIELLKEIHEQLLLTKEQGEELYTHVQRSLIKI